MESRHRKIPLSVLHFLAIVILPEERNTGDKSFPRSEAIPVLRSRLGYCQIDHDMAESVHGTEKKAPRQFIEALRGAQNAFRRH